MIPALAALVLARPDLDFYAVPATFRGSYVFIDVATSDGKKHPFLLDTGSASSYASKELANEGPSKTSLVPLEVGPARIPVQATPMDSKQLPTIAGTQVEGIIGLDSIASLQVEIDYDAATVRARKGSRFYPADSSLLRVPTEVGIGGLSTIQTRVGDQVLTLTLDTGATILALDKGRAKLDGARELPSLKMHTFDGTADTPRYLLDSIVVGGESFPWVVASLQPWTGVNDGVMGTPLLGDKIILDLPGRAVFFPKPTADSRRTQAVQRVLGMPVTAVGSDLVFKPNAREPFDHWSGAKLLALRGMKPAEIMAAIDGKAPDPSGTLVAAFKAVRQAGLMTAAMPGGKTQVGGLRIED